MNVAGSRHQHRRILGSDGWQKELLLLCNSALKGVMTEIDLDELRAELRDFAQPSKTVVISAASQRIIAGYEEVERFVVEHGRLPEQGEDRDIFERLYAV